MTPRYFFLLLVALILFTACSEAVVTPEESSTLDEDRSIFYAHQIDETISNESDVSDSSSFVESESISEAMQNNDLADWIGEYTYIYSTNPDAPEPEPNAPTHMVPRVFHYQLSIYEQNNEYFAAYGVSGPLVHFSILTSITCNNHEASLYYIEDLEGYEPSITEPREVGEFLFTLKKNTEGFLELINGNGEATDVLFEKEDATQK